VADSGAFHKKLLASADVELRDVHAEGNGMRLFVYNNTLPWSASDGIRRGDRVLATSKALNFLGELNNRKKGHDNAVLKLASVWDQRVAQAMQNLGGLADTSDYPSASEVAGLFSVSVELKPIPAIGDFSRLNVPGELAAALQARYANSAAVQVQNAMDDLRQRFITELERIGSQMSKVANGEKTRLYDTLITNMQTLVDMAKHMNLTGNPKLDELVARIEAKIIAHPVAVYKDNLPMATVLASDAKALATEAAMEEVWQ
jgi:cytochrome c556